VWRGHQCITCQCLFRYPFHLKVQGAGDTKEAAHSATVQLLRDAARRRCLVRRCPSCGTVQPEMLAWRSSRVAGCAFGLALIGAIGLLVATFCGDDLDPSTIWWATWISAVLAAAVVLGRYAPVLRSVPTTTVIDREPVPMSERTTWKGQWSSSLTVLVLSPLLIVSAEAVRWIAGWPTSEGWRPHVVSPGSSNRLIVGTLNPLAGHWKGDPKVVSADRKRPAIKAVTAVSKNEDWPASIKVKKEGSHSSSELWIDVVFPGDATLVDQIRAFDLSLEVTYLKSDSGGFFSERKDKRNKRATVHFASVGAKGLYTFLLRTGLLVGALLLVAASFRFWGWADRHNEQRGYVLPRPE
jgi:hypothetical protein